MEKIKYRNVWNISNKNSGFENVYLKIRIHGRWLGHEKIKMGFLKLKIDK